VGLISRNAVKAGPDDGYRVSPARRAVTAGSQAPAPGLASTCPAGQPRLLSRGPRDARQRYDDVIAAARRLADLLIKQGRSEKQSGRAGSA
jgi:hypothetical protein